MTRLRSDSAVGRLIIDARDRQPEVTNRELAGRLAVHETTISRWLAGARTPRNGFVDRLAHELGVTRKALAKARQKDLAARRRRRRDEQDGG